MVDNACSKKFGMDQFSFHSPSGFEDFFVNLAICESPVALAPKSAQISTVSSVQNPLDAWDSHSSFVAQTEGRTDRPANHPTTRPTTLQAHHWQEWQDSGVAPELIAANVRSFDSGYDCLCYGDRLERTNTGRLASPLLRRYAHTEAGGWWCSGLDPAADWQPMLWGCFKPDTPRVDCQHHKIIKYEHPPQVPTRAFFLDVPTRLWEAIAPKSMANSIPQPLIADRASNFWTWLLANSTVPIILVEGAKKAGCLLSLGYAAIALPGIFNGRRVTRDANGKVWAESLIPDLLPFATGDRPIYFCFDHDTKPTTIKNVNLAILRTGQLLAKQGCAVRVIALPGPEKGVDDLVMARGGAAFDQAFQEARSLTAWQWHQQKQAELTKQPWQVLNTADFAAAVLKIKDQDSQPAVELDHTQLLAAGPLAAGPLASQPCESQPLPSGRLASGILVLSSAKGTGKTKAIAHLVQTDQPVIAVGHRIALMRNLCDRLQLDYKDDIDKVNGRFITRDGYTLRLGLCADSLLAIDPNQFAGGILVIDEFMQVLRHILTSSTCNQDGKRPGLLARLQQLVRVAKLVILADADAADDGIDYFQHLKGPASPLHLIRNDYCPVGFPVEFLTTAQDDAIIHRILQDIQAGQKLFIATDSLGSSDALAKLIQQLPNPGNGLVINSATSGRQAERQVITNPNGEIARYDWVLATPSMATGVSIEIAHFDKVYGLFYGVSTDADVTQALNRVRSPIPRIVWCAPQGKNFNVLCPNEHPKQVEQALKLHLHREAVVLRASLGCPDTLLPAIFELAWDTNPHLKLFTQLVAKSNTAMWTLRTAVQERLQHEGSILEIRTIDTDLAMQSAMKQARAETKAAHYQAVAQAKLLSAVEIAALTHQETLQPADKLSLEKSAVAEFLVLDSVTATDVEFYSQYRGALLQLEALISGGDLSTERDLQAIARQIQWGNGILPFDQPYYELKRFVRDRLGLLPFLNPDQKWSNQDLAPLGNAARQHRQQVKEVLGFTIPTAEEHASNGWILRMLCNQLGLKIITHFEGPRGQQTKYFALDPAHYTRLFTILQRRNQHRATTFGFDPSPNLTPDLTADLTPDLEPDLEPDHTSDQASDLTPTQTSSQAPGLSTVSPPSYLNKLGEGQYPSPIPMPATNPQSTPKPPHHAPNIKLPWTCLSSGLKIKIQQIITTIHRYAGHRHTGQISEYAPLES